MKHGTTIRFIRQALLYATMLFVSASCQDPFNYARLNETERLQITEALAEVSQDILQSHVEAIAAGPRTARGAHTPISKAYIINQLQEADPQLEIIPEPVSYYQFTEDNIIAIKHGAEPGLAPLYVTAHWDTVWGSPGANDNASGCAAILEIARVLSTRTHKRDIVYIMFFFEEDGLIGAYEHVRNMERKPKAVLNMDLIAFTSEKGNAPPLLEGLLGFPSDGEYIGIFADRNSRQLSMQMARIIDDFVPGLPYYLVSVDNNLENNSYLQDIYRSDHGPFWEAGIPALFITDTAEFREDSPYHTPYDTPDSLNYGFFTKVVKAVLGTAMVYAGTP